MKSDTLHLFIKFHEEGSGEFQGVKTMQEHLDVMQEKGRVIWGHFTANPTKKGLWNKKIEIIDKQIKDRKETFVFFCDRANELLYVGNYINSYRRSQVERSHPMIEYIPKYYHHKVGTSQNPIEGELRSYAYIEVSNVIRVIIDEAESIYSNTNGKRILESEGMASILYVNLEDDFYKNLISKSGEKIEVKLDKISYEMLVDIEYQREIEEDYIYTIKEIIDKPIDKPRSKLINSGERWSRDTTKAKIAIAQANYKCEFDDSHNFFKSNLTNKNYVEAHHLIPLEYQDKFDVSLDVEANILSLCVVCHKKLHHGIYQEKKYVIEKLYRQRRDRLEKCRINISLEELIELYKI